MGVDLTLHVVSGAKPFHYCATRLDLSRDYDLLEALEPVAKSLVAEELGDVWAYAADEYKPLSSEDAYGNPVKFSTAGEMCAAVNGFHQSSDSNRAAFAYLRELPAPTPIVLDFH